MAHDTSHRRYRFAGRSLLNDSERSTGHKMMGVPWYAGGEWRKRKEAIQARVQRQIAKVQDRKQARELIKKGSAH